MLREQIYKTLLEIPLTTGEIATILTADIKDVKQVLSTMREEGQIINNKQGQYTVSDSSTGLNRVQVMIERLSASAV